MLTHVNAETDRQQCRRSVSGFILWFDVANLFGTREDSATGERSHTDRMFVLLSGHRMCIIMIFTENPIELNI